jgi:hypothetical protein
MSKIYLLTRHKDDGSDHPPVSQYVGYTYDKWAAMEWTYHGPERKGMNNDYLEIKQYKPKGGTTVCQS